MVGAVPSHLPYSTRKFLRREKARIRRGFSDMHEAEKKIQDLVAATFQHYKIGKGKLKK